jgi:hypothetical protein
VAISASAAATASLAFCTSAFVARSCASYSGKVKARIALARRLAIIMHAMLRDGTEFIAAQA